MSACDACLRRTELIAAIAPRLDIEWRRRSAPAGVLALPDEDLLALDPTGCAERGYGAFSADGARDRAERAGLGLICRCDDGYPAGLLELADAPAVLHVAGRAEALAAEAAAAIVGARRGDPVRDRDRPRAGAEPRRRGRPGRLRHGARHRLGRARRRARRAGPAGAGRRPRRWGGRAVPRIAAAPVRAAGRARVRRLRAAARVRRLPLVLRRPQPDHRGARGADGGRRGRGAVRLADDRRLRGAGGAAGARRARADHVAVLRRHERADRRRRGRGPRDPRRARPAARPDGGRRAPGVRRRRSRSSRASGSCSTRSSAATAASRSSSPGMRRARRCCATSPTWSSADWCGGTSAGATSGRSGTTGPDYPDVHAEPRPRRALDRRLRLRRRRRDPGGSEGIRALRRPRHDGAHRADRAEHRGGDRRPPGARRVHRRAGARGRRRHRRRRGQDRHARHRGDRRRGRRGARPAGARDPRGDRPRDGLRVGRACCSTTPPARR